MKSIFSFLFAALLSLVSCSGGGGGGGDDSKSTSSSKVGLRIIHTALESAPANISIDGVNTSKAFFMGEAPRKNLSGSVAIQLASSNDTIFSAAVDTSDTPKTLLIASRDLDNTEIPQVYTLTSVARSSDTVEIIHGLNGAGSVSYTITDGAGNSIATGSLSFGTNTIVEANGDLVISFTRSVDRKALGSISVPVEARTVVVGGDVDYFSEVRVYQ